MSERFVKGQSGNPGGRPRARRPNISAFDIIFDKTLTVTQNGVQREFTVDEALQLQAYQAALSGSKLAVRTVLKMIEKREAAIAKSAPPSPPASMSSLWENDPRNADEAMLLLGITVRDPEWTGECQYGVRMKMENWAVQAGISRLGRGSIDQRKMNSIRRCALDPDKLKWPRGDRHG